MKFLRRIYLFTGEETGFPRGSLSAGRRAGGRPGRQPRKIGGDHAVAPGIKAGVLRLVFRVGLDISGTPAYALVKAYVGTKPGNQAFDFAVVKDHGMRLVAEQSAEEVCVEGGEKVAGNVDEVRLYPKCPPNGAAGVVPGQRFVAGDVDGLPNGFGVAHQATKALGKIRVVGEGPQGEAVPVHNNGLASIRRTTCQLPLAP